MRKTERSLKYSFVFIVGYIDFFFPTRTCFMKLLFLCWLELPILLVQALASPHTLLDNLYNWKNQAMDAEYDDPRRLRNLYFSSGKSPQDVDQILIEEDSMEMSTFLTEDDTQRGSLESDVRRRDDSNSLSVSLSEQSPHSNAPFPKQLYSTKFESQSFPSGNMWVITVKSWKHETFTKSVQFRNNRSANAACKHSEADSQPNQ